MNLRRSRVARATASVAALALLVGPSAAGAWAQETPAPEPTPEVEATPLTPEEVEDQAHDDGKHRPTIPEENTFNLGQSMQIRVNADGEQNAKLVNFRWSVSQVAIQGPPDGSKDGDYVVPVPEGGALPRYLDNFGFIHVENGYGQWDMTVEDGWAQQRSVSIYPQDGTPNISLKTEFTLDGQPVKAQDIVGKDGLVTATYTLTNNTTAPYDVVVKDINGADVTVTAEGDQPMVAITKTLLPQRYIGLNTGSGLYGADGRGNNQIQWITLPFKPLAEDSTASFGWAAYVTDAVIPSLLTQVQPLYIPAHPPGEEPVEEEAESSAPPIPLDPAIAEIQAGWATVLAGLDSLANQPEDPNACDLACISGKINTIKQDLLGIPGALIPQLETAKANVDSEIAFMTGYDASVKAVADADLPGVPAAQSALATKIGTDGTLGCPTAWCAEQVAPGGQLEAITTAGANDAKQLAEDWLASYSPARTLLGNTVPGLTYVAKTASSAAIQTSIDDLNTRIANQEPFEPVDLVAAAQQAIATLKSDLLIAGGSDVQAGLDQVSGGVAQAKDIIGAYVAALSEQVQVVIAQVQAGVISANDALIHLRGNIGALKAAAAQSPLIYGPLPPGMPPDTALFGAYEFRIDAADNNHPYTLPRILIGLLALIAAGLIVKYVGNRNRDDDGLRDDYTASPVT